MALSIVSENENLANSDDETVILQRAPTFCGDCGELVSSEGRYCGNCGVLQESESAGWCVSAKEMVSE